LLEHLDDQAPRELAYSLATSRASMDTRGVIGADRPALAAG